MSCFACLRRSISDRYRSRPSHHPPQKTQEGAELRSGREDKYAVRVNRSAAATTTKIFPFVAVSKSRAAAVRPPYALSLITRAREQNVFYTCAATASSTSPFGADSGSGKSFGRRLRGRKRSSRVVVGGMAECGALISGQKGHAGEKTSRDLWPGRAATAADSFQLLLSPRLTNNRPPLPKITLARRRRRFGNLCHAG